MQNKKGNLEDFKLAISSTVRSLSNSHNIEISFGNEIFKENKNSIKLPNLTNFNNKINYEEIRASADSKSLSGTADLEQRKDTGKLKPKR